jgi:hypothetical protein
MLPPVGSGGMLLTASLGLNLGARPMLPMCRLAGTTNLPRMEVSSVPVGCSVSTPGYLQGGRGWWAEGQEGGPCISSSVEVVMASALVGRKLCGSVHITKCMHAAKQDHAQDVIPSNITQHAVGPSAAAQALAMQQAGVRSSTWCALLCRHSRVAGELLLAVHAGHLIVCSSTAAWVESGPSFGQEHMSSLVFSVWPARLKRR